jgi:hypothetical protein
MFCVAQKFLILDAYGFRRTKLYVGDEVTFRTHDTPLRYSGVIIGLLDSAIFVTGFTDSIRLKDIHTFYFRRKGTPSLRAGLSTFAIGFGGAALVHPLIPNANYDAQESAIIAASSLALSQFFRLFKWRKFTLKHKKRRARIIDLYAPNPTVS